MQFDTKIAVVIRTDLEAWQKLNVAAFLAGGIAAAFPECIGEAYEDGSGTQFLSLIGQPILIYGADRAALTRALERALARGVRPAISIPKRCSKPPTTPPTAPRSRRSRAPISIWWGWRCAPSARCTRRAPRNDAPNHEKEITETAVFGLKMTDWSVIMKA
jgi:hypothetical protein